MSQQPGWIRITLALALIVPGPLAGQDAFPSVYASYFECDPQRQARVDSLTRQTFAPLFDRWVADKKVMAWGWQSHNLGGPWSRLSYFVAPNRDAALEMQRGMLTELRTKHGKALAEFNSICPSHDDYIWNGIAASRPGQQVGQARTSAAYSIYYECAMGRESRADSLVRQRLAPIWSRQVKEGGLTSWSWLAHSIGGKYRRLLVLDGPSHRTILASADSILAEIGKERPAEGREFSEICPSHQDYLWDIQIARP